jgi:S1-C subfamily serine protease
MLAIVLGGIALLSLTIVMVWFAHQARNNRLAAERIAVAERVAAEAKVSAEKAAAEEKAVADKRVAEERVMTEKRIAEEKAAAEKTIAEENKKAAAAKKAADEKAAASKQMAKTGGVADQEGPSLTSVKDDAGIKDAVGLVVIGLSATGYLGEQDYHLWASGSAFAINHNGAMLTNKHVVDEYLKLGRAKELKRDFKAKTSATLEEQVWVFVRSEKFDAKVVYISRKNDYAVLHVDHQFPKPFRLKIVPDEMLDADVRAIGFPGTATEGFSDQEILTKETNKNAWHKDIADCLNERDLQYVLTSGRVSQVTDDTVLKAKWLQHSAGIAHGSSGGPLVLFPNATVIGVNTLVAHDFKQGNGTEFYRALFLGQFRDDLDKHVPGILWVQ